MIVFLLLGHLLETPLIALAGDPFPLLGIDVLFAPFALL